MKEKTIEVINKKNGMVEKYTESAYYSMSKNKLIEGKKKSITHGIITAVAVMILTFLITSGIDSGSKYVAIIALGGFGFLGGAAVNLSQLYKKTDFSYNKMNSCLKIILIILFFVIALIYYAFYIAFSPITFTVYLMKVNKLIEEYDMNLRRINKQKQMAKMQES